MVNQPLPLQNGCITRRASQVLKRSSSQISRWPSPTMNKALFCLIFLLGACVAFFVTLLGDYFKDGSRKVTTLGDASHLGIENVENHLFSSSQVDASTQVVQRPTDNVAEASRAARSEALNSLNVALEMKRQNKVDKAHKLFQHAMALAPRLPSVLNHYGEFLEESNRDLMKADHLFVRAIAFSSDDSDEHVRALGNRRRTAMKVDEMDNEVLKRIDSKKQSFQKIKENSAALKRAKKEAYFQYIYHTVGIEGNTMSLAQTRSILETKLAVAGKSIMEHNEILGLDAALKFINQTLVDKIGDITINDILEIHRRVIGHVDPIDAGMFRRTQVYIADHIPPAPSLVELLVTKLVTWFNSYQALTLHPVRLAALAHYKLVYIHPFHDGNGRTSRLLMNLVLMQAGFPPVIIRKQDREFYYRYLTTANEGDIRPFIRFIAECTERTLDAYLWATHEYELKPIEIEKEEGTADLPKNIIEHPLDILYHDLHDFRGTSEEMEQGVPEMHEHSDTIILGQGVPELHEHSDTIILGSSETIS